MRAFGIQAAKRRGDREVNNLPGFVSVDRVRPGGMSRKGRMAIQYQVSDSVHRFIYPPDTSSSRVEGMEGPSNSKIPVSIRSNLLGQARARGIEPFVRCLNRIAARNAKDSFFFLSFFLFCGCCVSRSNPPSISFRSSRSVHGWCGFCCSK